MKSEVLINVKTHSICISFNDSRHGINKLYYFDKKGRLIGAYVDGRNIKRSLDDRLHQQWSVEENGLRYRRRRMLTGNKKSTFFTQMSQAVTLIYHALLKGDNEGISITAARGMEASRETTIDWLSKIAAFDEVARKRDEAGFRFANRSSSLQVSTYDIREFIY